MHCLAAQPQLLASNWRASSCSRWPLSRCLSCLSCSLLLCWGLTLDSLLVCHFPWPSDSEFSRVNQLYPNTDWGWCLFVQASLGVWRTAGLSWLCSVLRRLRSCCGRVGGAGLSAWHFGANSSLDPSACDLSNRRERSNCWCWLPNYLKRSVTSKSVSCLDQPYQHLGFHETAVVVRSLRPPHQCLPYQFTFDWLGSRGLCPWWGSRRATPSWRGPGSWRLSMSLSFSKLLRHAAGSILFFQSCWIHEIVAQNSASIQVMSLLLPASLLQLLIGLVRVSLCLLRLQLASDWAVSTSFDFA